MSKVIIIGKEHLSIRRAWLPVMVILFFFVGACSDATAPANERVAPTDSTIHNGGIQGSVVDAGDTIPDPGIPEKEIREIEIGTRINEESEILGFLNELESFQIEACREYSVTIMFEGPHCDLTEWKHGYSDWETINVMEDPRGYREIEQLRPESSKGPVFPQIDIEEMKLYVRTYFGEYCYKRIQNITSPFEYPAGVSTSRYIFRVTGRRLDNGLYTTRYFHIDEAMGC